MNAEQLQKSMITLSQEELTQLETLVGDIPTKFGLPILDYLKYLFQKQNPQPQQPQEVSEVPVVEGNFAENSNSL